MNPISFLPNPMVSTRSVSDLREAVGWGRRDREHSDELKGYWATLGGFDENGTLMAWCALLSDGKYHGILLDVLVHLCWQKQGLDAHSSPKRSPISELRASARFMWIFAQNEPHFMSVAGFASG